MIPTRESAVLSILTRQMMTGLKQCEPSNDEQDRITIYGPKANATYLEPWGPRRNGSLESRWGLRMQRQVKAKSLSVKIPKNEPTTVRLNCVLANEEFLTLEIPRYALERFMVQAKRAIEEAPLLSRRRSSANSRRLLSSTLFQRLRACR